MIAILVFFVLGLFIVTMLAVSSMKKTLQDLRQEFARLSARVGELERTQPPARDWDSSVPATPAIPLALPAGAVHPGSREPAAPSPAPLPPGSPPPAHRVSPVAASPSTSAPPPPPARSRAEWEALIGGKFLNRIGALALIIGMGFFLKYAFDKNWISEWLRVGIGAAAGVALLVGGRQSHRRDFQLFAQGLVGAGIAILYLSVYATFNFYHLVSQPVAFVLMAGVTVLAFTQAFLYEAMAVSLLGWLGGFLTPFLLSTGETHPVALFTYLAMLDLGLIADSPAQLAHSRPAVAGRDLLHLLSLVCFKIQRNGPWYSGDVSHHILGPVLCLGCADRGPRQQARNTGPDGNIHRSRSRVLSGIVRSP